MKFCDKFHAAIEMGIVEFDAARNQMIGRFEDADGTPQRIPIDYCPFCRETVSPQIHANARLISPEQYFAELEARIDALPKEEKKTK